MKRMMSLLLVVIIALAVCPLSARAITIFSWGGEKKENIQEKRENKNNVRLSPSVIKVLKGGDIAVEVVIAGADNVFGVGFDLSYNPFLLEFVRAEKGNFFQGDGNQAWLLTAVKNNPPGTLVFGLTRVGRKSGGVYGEGVAARLIFRALASGETALSFSEGKSALCVLKGDSHEFVTKEWGNSFVKISDGSESDNSVVLKFQDNGKEAGR